MTLDPILGSPVIDVKLMLYGKEQLIRLCNMMTDGTLAQRHASARRVAPIVAFQDYASSAVNQQ